jgi:hypothetical protein
MTRRDPRPRLASRRWLRLHAHPPEVCPAVDIDAHACEIRLARDVAVVLIGASAPRNTPSQSWSARLKGHS